MPLCIQPAGGVGSIETDASMPSVPKQYRCACRSGTSCPCWYGPSPRNVFATRCGCLLRWRCRRCRFSDCRIAPRTSQNLVPSPECWSRCLQAVCRSRPCQNVAGGRLERLHARQWDQLRPHCSVLSCPVWQLQFLQEGEFFQIVCYTYIPHTAFEHVNATFN